MRHLALLPALVIAVVACTETHLPGEPEEPMAETGSTLDALGLGFRTVSAGFDHACGLTTAGTAYCWGYNQFGELGAGMAPGSSSNVPLPVAGGLTFAHWVREGDSFSLLGFRTG